MFYDCDEIFLRVIIALSEASKILKLVAAV